MSLSTTGLTFVTGGLAVLAFISPAQAEKPAAPSAAQSDPVALGWMRGFPPPPDKLIMQPDSDFFSFPKMRWTVCHIRELMPTKEVSRGIGAPVPMTYALDEGIAKVTFKPIGGERPMTWNQSLSANYTDGILVLHKGRIVHEKYFGALVEAGKHAAMSMTKSMTGLLAEILVAEGTLD
ncbi:MAG: 6-aminohexanoate hydrolase, partial [Akkermansiaceae bacterium]